MTARDDQARPVPADMAEDPYAAPRWRPRFTIRARLTITVACLLGLAGVAMVATVTVFMRTVPTYVAVNPSDIGAHASTDGAFDKPAGQSPGGADASQSSSRTGTSGGIALRSPTDILDTTLKISMIALVMLLIGGSIVALLISGRMLRPLQSINRAAKLASTASFDHRVHLGRVS